MVSGAVDVWMGNAAAVLRGAWGAVTRRAQHSASRRTAVYTPTQRVVHAVASAQASEISGSVAKLGFGGKIQKSDLGKSMACEFQLSCFR